ncbi:MAG: class I SAM-dependent methyltransferase [Ktedonobacteraceae bacterium]
MTLQSKQAAEQSTKRSPTIVIGNFKVMHRPGLLFERTKAQLEYQGFQVEETRHFLLAHLSNSEKTILAHRFQPQEIDNNLVDYLMQELASILTTDQAFGNVMIGIVNSLLPYDWAKAWDIFSMNTLNRLREQMAQPDRATDQQTTIGASAAVYSRLLTLKTGKSLLDVGCACAFWLVLAAERPFLSERRLVGVDNRRDAINLSKNLARASNMPDLAFLQLDLLDPQFGEQLGTFDTVTAIHILEHLPEVYLHQAFEHLLQVTQRRLIVAVPYETQPTLAYGHLQVFTREKLERWGRWCVEWIGGAARYWCEETASGLLIVDIDR